MSDTTNAQPKKQKKAFDIVRFMNKERTKEGLPKVLTKEKIETPKVTSETKRKIIHHILNELFPGALTEKSFVVPEKMQDTVEKEYKKRIELYKTGKLKIE